MIFLSSSTIRPPRRSDVMKPSAPELAGVQRGPQLAQRLAVVLGHDVLARLDEHEVPRAPVRGREAHVALALLGR